MKDQPTFLSYLRPQAVGDVLRRRMRTATLYSLIFNSVQLRSSVTERAIFATFFLLHLTTSPLLIDRIITSVLSQKCIWLELALELALKYFCSVEKTHFVTCVPMRYLFWAVLHQLVEKFPWYLEWKRSSEDAYSSSVRLR